MASPLLLLGLLACGGRAERAWSGALQAELAAAASEGRPWWLGGGGEQPAGPGKDRGPLGPVLENLERQRSSPSAGGKAQPMEQEKVESVKAASVGGGPPNGLVRQSSQSEALGVVRAVDRKAQPIEPEQTVASGSDPKEEQRFLEHLHASGTPPDDLARAAPKLDGGGNSRTPPDDLARAAPKLDGGGERAAATPLPEEIAAGCNTENGTDPKQMLATLNDCTKALDRLAEQTRSMEQIDKAANEKDVQALKHTEEDLLALKNPKSFHEAWDTDQQAALKHLLGQVSKDEVSIENLAAPP